MAKEALILYIESEDREQLNALAAEQDRTVSAVARRMLEKALRDLKKD